MIEEIQRAGTRRDQARQLLVELETRGSQAFVLFVVCLKETGQHSLADALQGRRWRPCGKTSACITKTSACDANTNLSSSCGETHEPPSNPVVKTKLLDIEKDYPLNFDPCGYCLIINNMEFAESTGLSYRAGSDIDRQKMEMRMRLYHFEVSVKTNLKGMEIHEELQRLASRDHSKRDCCLVIILSHGCETRHKRGFRAGFTEQTA
ncbi:unnamed protein product [Staurois parvus]|uniref:Caspase-9 n=1 Tax=Staurois parvus TaxID=386267 RepID=A0ABN9DZ03_9NEOB|nr:unnamed protein product [Staurois parvus]